MNLSTEIYLPGDIIVQEGDVGRELYIINKGRVTLQGRRRGSVGELSSGMFFGEIALLEHTRRTLSIFAKTMCELNVLDQEIFDAIVKEYPQFGKKMSQLAHRRKSQDRRSMEDAAATIQKEAGEREKEKKREGHEGEKKEREAKYESESESENESECGSAQDKRSPDVSSSSSTATQEDRKNLRRWSTSLGRLLIPVMRSLSPSSLHITKFSVTLSSTDPFEGNPSLRLSVFPH